MIRAAHHPQDRRYPSVGAQGVRVCDRWRKSFKNFLADMGEPPRGARLERIDETKDFGPDNCFWRGPGTRTYPGGLDG